MLFIFKPYVPTFGSDLFFIRITLLTIGWRNHCGGVAVKDQFR
jgi:hypothetical protein